MPIREYICTTTECPENTGHFPTSHRIIELFVKMNEHPVCEVCGYKLTQIMSASKGYVSGTTNPCKNNS